MLKPAICRLLSKCVGGVGQTFAPRSHVPCPMSFCTKAILTTYFTTWCLSAGLASLQEVQGKRSCFISIIFQHALEQIALTTVLQSWLGLQDLIAYKRFKERALALAARPLITYYMWLQMTTAVKSYLSAGLDSIQEVQGEGSGFSSTFSHHPLQGHSPVHAGEEGQRKRSGSRSAAQAVWSCLCCGESNYFLQFVPPSAV